MKRLGRVAGAFIALLALLLTSAISTVTAFADTGGGGLTGGGGNRVNPGGWRVITSTRGGLSAYDKFVGNNGFDGGGGVGYSGQSAAKTRSGLSQISSSSGTIIVTDADRTLYQRARIGVPKNLMQLCKSADNIFIFQDSKPFLPGRQDQWLQKYTGSTMPPKGNIPSITEAVPFEPKVMPARRALDGKKATFDSYAALYQHIGKRLQTMNLGDHTTIVCDISIVAGPGDKDFTCKTDPSIKDPVNCPPVVSQPPPSDETRVPCVPQPGQDENCEPIPSGPGPNAEKVGERSEFREKKWTEEYSWTSQVEDQVDHAGAKNLHDQMGNPVISNYGQLVEQVRAGALYRSDQLDRLVKEALAKDKTMDHGKVDLDEANKTGLSEGGVLNVKELTKPAYLYAQDQRIWDIYQNCVWVTPSSTDADGNVTYGTPYKSCGPRYEVPRPWQPLKNEQQIQQQFLSAFWQMLSVRCNAEEFEAAVSAVEGATIEDTGDPENHLAAVAYSQTYRAPGKMQALQLPVAFDFGDATNSDEAAARTAQPGFYTKECPFNCSADPRGAGATQANGAVQNVRNTKPAGGTVAKYGAVSGVTNDNKFQFFRDNVDHKIKVDTWYPTTGGLVNYRGEAPITTTITRWEEGTPSLDGSSGGRFSMTSTNGNVKVFGAPGEPRQQKNWSKDEFQTDVASSLSGLHREFNVRATWASDKDKPQIFNVKWEYAPKVDTSFAATVGFDKNREGTRGGRATVAVPVEGKCYANFGRDTTDRIEQLVHDNTGSDSDNGLDGSLLKEQTGDDATDLVVNFVRATTE